MTSLATIIHARQAAAARSRLNGSHITPVERTNIIEMLKTRPLPEVHRRTGRAYSTLLSIIRTEGL